MPDQAVSAIPINRMEAMQPLHASGEILLAQLDHEVMMIRHQHPIQDAPTTRLHHVVEEMQEVTARCVVAEHRYATTATPDHVKWNTNGLQARTSSHA